MSNATPVTVTGWVANDLSVSTTQTGKRYVNVNVPHQRQKKNQQGGYDNQGETTWYQATFWDDEADTIVSAVQKRTKVIVSGVPEAYAYTKGDGTAAVSVRLLFPTLGVVPTVNAPQAGAQGRAASPQPNTTWTGGGFNDESPF
jgi:single-stranded DNA-binding protein